MGSAGQHRLLHHSTGGAYRGHVADHPLCIVDVAPEAFSGDMMPGRRELTCLSLLGKVRSG
jgi:hypothetical protein